MWAKIEQVPKFITTRKKEQDSASDSSAKYCIA